MIYRRNLTVIAVSSAALALVGAQYAGWNEARFKLYRRAETYLLKLIRLRSRERPPAFGRPSPLGSDVEPLFEGGTPPTRVHFVGDSGKYEAGSIARAEKAKLPPDAVEIVEQLLIWLPHDERDQPAREVLEWHADTVFLG